MTGLPRSLRHRAPFLWILLPFVAGLILGRILPFSPPPLPLFVVAVAGAVLARIFADRPWIWSTCLCLGLVLAGCGYYTARRNRLADWDSLPPREVHLILRVDRIFVPQPGAKSFAGLGRIVETDTHLRELTSQRIYFSAQRASVSDLPVRSAEIAVTGVLQALPRRAPGSTFEGYLANLGLNFRLDRARITGQPHPPTAYRAFCERLVNRMNALLGEGVAAKRPALTAIFRAMMLGQKHDLSSEQDALFMHSGTMHLFAINGLHIGVVALSLHLFLALLRLPRTPATFVTLAILWLDVDTTGASPSAVRAFLLVASVELAFVLRRPGNGLAALVNAALFVAVLDPLSVFSASFQMSYGVAFSILCLGLPLSDYLQKHWSPYKHLPKASRTRWHRGAIAATGWLAGATAIGWSATLVSIVTGIQFFHVLVPGGLFANLVLVPMAALVISAGFVAVAGGLLGLAAVSVWFNHAAVLVLLVIDWLIRSSSGLPGAWFPAEWRQDWLGAAAYVTLLASCLAGYSFAWRMKRGGFLAPVFIVAVALLFGVKFG